jgi:cytochrome oxidase assembly protein ShyY1
VTHLPYIMAAYGIAALLSAGFAVAAWRRTGRARRRLAALDPRGQR